MSGASTLTIAGRSGGSRDDDRQPGDLLGAIAGVPSSEQDRLLREHGEAVADHMANHFARLRPHLAASSGFALWQRVAGVTAALGAVALLVIAPLVLSVILVAAIAAITAAHLVIAIAARWRRPRADAAGHAAAIPDAALPSYTILVPAYQEQDVIGGMVRCLEQLDYPQDRLEALILVERRDAATKRAIADADPAPFIRVVEIPPGPPQTKPRSCNAGLLLAKGDLIVIYDAEDRPDPGQLRVVAAQFAAADDTLACVQAKLMVANAGQSFITRQFALEYCLRYELTLPGLARLGLPIPLGGTSNHFRTQVLRELGGIYVAARQYADARNELAIYSERRPYDPEGLYYYGQALEGLGDTAAARDAYVRAVDADQTAPRYRRRYTARWSRLAQKQLGKLKA